MPTYRVRLDRNPLRSMHYVWDWAQTVVCSNPDVAVQRSYNDWKREVSYADTIPELRFCDREVQEIRAYAVRLQNDAEKAFVQEIENKVKDFLKTKLDGDFNSINYPSGFHYGITYGNNAYYNGNTLDDLDSMIGVDQTGVFLSGEKFSTMYYEILQNVGYQLSHKDEEKMQKADQEASAQIASVLTEYENLGGVYSSPLPVGGKIQDIWNFVAKEYKTIEGIPFTMSGLRNALTKYKQLAQDSFKLHDNKTKADLRIDGAIENIKKPTAENGGLQIEMNKFYVGYLPLPTATQLISGLSADNNKIDIMINMSNFSDQSSDLKIAGGISFSVPIYSILNISVEGGGSYSLSNYTSAATAVTMELQYPGVTLVSTRPKDLSVDNSTGWYCSDIIRDIVQNANKDVTGYHLISDKYDIENTFGLNKLFARLKTFVISQQPIIKLTFSNANATQLLKDYKIDSSVKLDLLGFKFGEVSGTYKVSDIRESLQEGTITVTFGSTPVSGTIPLQYQIANVLGGVCSYPPYN